MPCPSDPSLGRETHFCSDNLKRLAKKVLLCHRIYGLRNHNKIPGRLTRSGNRHAKPRRRRLLQRRHLQAAGQPERAEGLVGLQVAREGLEAARGSAAEAVHGAQEPLEDPANRMKQGRSNGTKKAS